MSLNIESSIHENAVVVVRVDGEITFENSDVLRSKIDELCEQGHIKMVIDLEQLKYMSSAGMGVLVHGVKKTRQANGDLRLCNLNSKMRRIFMITQFNHHFQVLKSLDEALESFKSESSR